MKTFFLTTITLLFSFPAFAKVNCTANVTYSYMKDGQVTSESQALTVSPAPDRENTIVSARMLGQQLATTYSPDEATVTDTSNYLNKAGDISFAVSSATVIPWSSDGTITIKHNISQASSNGQQPDTVDASFTMTCTRE